MARLSAHSIVVGTLLGAGVVSETKADWQVWTTTQTVRVLRQAPAGSGVSVRLSAARSEWESFQILMRSDAAVKAVNVEPADLRSSTGQVLPAADARLYRQHQLELTLPTYRNDAFRHGWYPDPLIPFRHPQTRLALDSATAKLRAVPFGESSAFLPRRLRPRLDRIASDEPPEILAQSLRCPVAIARVLAEALEHDRLRVLWHPRVHLPRVQWILVHDPRERVGVVLAAKRRPASENSCPDLSICPVPRDRAVRRARGGGGDAIRASARVPRHAERELRPQRTQLPLSLVRRVGESHASGARTIRRS